MNILAIDYGTKFTGLATFHKGRDPFPMPLGRIKYVSDDQLIQDIKKTIEEEFIEAVVLGLPHLTDGQATNMTKTIQAFGKVLCEQIKPIKYFEQDETLSSFEAKERMKSSPRYNFQIDMTQIDAVAASIILEDFVSSSD